MYNFVSKYQLQLDEISTIVVVFAMSLMLNFKAFEKNLSSFDSISMSFPEGSFPSFQSSCWFHHVLAKMLIKVKTLTGKEIEIDIEPTDKVERIKVDLWMKKLT